MIKIEFKDIHKAFGKNTVLEGFNLSVEEGETLVVIGRSGCGKSVMLKHMIVLIKPDFGKIFTVCFGSFFPVFDVF